MSLKKKPGISFFVPLLIFMVPALAFVIFAPDRTELLLSLSNDNAMRVVQIRDLLHGQNWFDLTQYRLGLNDGIEMHWSRIVDGPIAALILLFDLFMDRQNAEHLALIIWPIALLGTAIWATYMVAARLGDRYAAIFASLLSALAIARLQKFQPGAVDHHNVQFVLLLLAVLGAAGRHEHYRFAFLSGLSIAFSLSVGVELLPLMALIALGFSGFWVINGAAERKSAISFSVALALGLTILFAVSAPKSAYTGGFCDALSRDVFLPVILGAVSIGASAALFSNCCVIWRIGILGALFSATAALTLAIAPACSANPLDVLGPFLHEHWLSRVVEARSLIGLVQSGINQHMLGFYALGAVAFVLSVHLARRKANSELWFLIASLIALSLSIALYQVRGVIAVAALAVFPIAQIASELMRQAKHSGSVRPVWMVIGLLHLSLILLLLPNTWSAFNRLISPRGPANLVSSQFDSLVSKYASFQSHCFSTEAFDALGALAPGIVSASSNLGAQILLNTHHRVLSAPYHRNQDGMIAQLRIAFSKNDKDAKEMLRRYQVNYVVICDLDPANYNRSGKVRGWFSATLLGEKEPSFLNEVPMLSDSPLRIFEVR